MHHCEVVDDQLVSGPAQHDIQLSEELCDGFGGSDTELVYLKPKTAKSRSLIFSYGRTAASPTHDREDLPPTVNWIDDKHVLIAIDMIDSIGQQNRTVDGVSIDYRVGHVVYPAR